MKYFEHPLVRQFTHEQVRPRFNRVYYRKPASSRDESAEGYIICTGFKGCRDIRTWQKPRPLPERYLSVADDTLE